jgi:hypothetical protein
MRPEQEALLEEAVAEAARDPQFGRALRSAIDNALPKKRRRRQPAVVDVFAVYEKGGEQELRGVLAFLGVDELKDIVAQHRMDRAQLAMKWRTPERFIELIVATTLTRAHKGEAFRRSAVTDPMPTLLPHVDEPVDARRAYNELSAPVREAALRQASDFVAPVYAIWKEDLKGAGVTWQLFQSVGSKNRDAWRGWLSGELTWDSALEELVERLNQSASMSLVLSE